MTSTWKFVLIGMDGFRPEMMDAQLTPNLHALARGGVEFRHHRCAFPSETYVNLPSLVTGSPVAGHGIVANSFLDPGFDRRRTWEAGRGDHVESRERAHAGRLFTAPSLGELLGDSGRRMVAISCNPTGGARLKHHRAGDYAGHLCLSVVDWRVSVPHQRAADMVARLGTPAVGIAPEAVAARQTWATDAFLDLAAREGVPDVSILWFEEPDESYHDYGIGTPTNLELMRHVDTELGRLVEWWKRQPDAERINLMVLSDHAHITQIGRLSVADILGEQGLRVGRHLEDDADLALETGYCGHLRVREGDKRTLDKAAAVLMAHPGTGMLFSRGRNEVEGICPGTLARSLVFTEHPFAPDLYFVLANDDATDANGFTGTCRYDNDLIPGAGIHGGLHPKELNNLLVASGACIAEGVRVQTPSGIYDIAPTLLHAMGLPVPQTMHGRVLTAGLAAGDDEPGEVVPEVFETGSGGFTQRLRRSRIGYSLYLEGGRRV